MSIDPAFYSFANNPQFIGLAYDSLVTFQQSPGAAGLRLVPDLALSIPTPTDGGTTYAFRAAPGDPLLRRPAVARRRLPPRDRAPVPRRIARQLALHAASSAQPPAPERPRSCDLSRGIVTDDTAGHRHLSPHRAGPRLPVQADRVRLLSADPARNAGPRNRLAHRPRHRPVQDRRRQPHRDPLRPQPVLSRVVARRPAGRQPRLDRVANRALRAGGRDRDRAATRRLAVSA